MNIFKGVQKWKITYERKYLTVLTTVCSFELMARLLLPPCLVIKRLSVPSSILKWHLFKIQIVIVVVFGS